MLNERLRALLIFPIIVSSLLAVSSEETPEGSLSSNERFTLARLRTLAELRGMLPWREFDPFDSPIVVHEKGRWALAVGFEAAPPGFVRLSGVMVADRPVDRDATGHFAASPWSPDTIAGRWSVIAEIEPPAPLPAGDRPGARSAEQILADIVADAFTLHLMRRRGSAVPYASTPTGYPDSAEVAALTALEHRLIREGLAVGALTEDNLAEFKRLGARIVAVHQERWRLLGDDLAGAERDAENRAGLREDAAIVLHTKAQQGTFLTQGLEGDPAFTQHSMAGLYRGLATRYVLGHRVDGPTATMAQITTRACALGALIGKLDGAWRQRMVAGDRSLADLLAATVGMNAAERGTLLQEGRVRGGYDGLLEMARVDLAALQSARAAARDALLPPGSRSAVIRLDGTRLTQYRDDPRSVIHLGEGRMLHDGPLRLTAPGLSLESSGNQGAARGARIVTRAQGWGDAVSEVVLLEPPGAATVGLLDQLAGGSGESARGEIRFEGGGIRGRIEGGRISTGSDGSLLVDLRSGVQTRAAP